MEIEVPDWSAADWLTVLMQPEWTVEDLIIEMVPSGVSLLLDDVFAPEDVPGLAFDLIEEASGRHWWVAMRLITVLVDTWDIMSAEAIFNGVDAERLSLAGWLDAMLVLLMRRIDPDQAAMFTSRLEMVPADEEVDPQELEMSPQQFLAMGNE